ncbi:hypothetical protein [Lichenicoccus sp.]|uniref:hypothetical protein n=1 Tax=Lichenicoccus sp. TaxID=2781899 RepID=UPI003D0E2861
MARRRGEAPAASPSDVVAVEVGFRLRFPYGFIDEDGTHRFWGSGAVVENTDDLALLRARRVDLEEA